MTISKLAWLASAAFLSLSASASAAVLYNQPTDLGGGFYSEYDPTSASGVTSYDDFTLGSAANVATVDFVGSFVSTEAPISSFSISFYGDDSGIPGTLLSTATISGNGGETFVATDAQNNPTYSYSIALPTAFDVAAGTTYWLSVVANLSSPPGWAWETATGGDGISYQTFSDDSDLNGTNPVDLAFSLEDATAAVPEPWSISLFGAGLIGLALVRRRSALLRP